MNLQIPLLPEAASNWASSIDFVFLGLVVFSMTLGLFLSCLVVGFAVRYRAGANVDRSGRRANSLPLEIGWTGGSFAVAVALFGWGAVPYLARDDAPPGALEIAAIGKQWMWKFRHPGGQREINELHVPVGRPVVITFGSQDVIHSFFVPAFRVKQDVVPGRTTRVWFTATQRGRFHLFCAEYCGTQHSRMRGEVVVMEPERYAAWLDSQGEAVSLAQAGARLFRALGCSGCHGNSSQVRAPPLEGVYGRPVALEGGRTVIADERYLRDSILLPRKEVAAGYRPVMPSFDGLLEEDELQTLVAYIKSLSSREGR